MSPRRWTSGPVRCSLVALVLAAGATACSEEEVTPAGPLPVRAEPSLPSVADSISQAGVPRLVNLIVRDGRAIGVGDVVEVDQNVPVRLTVTADVADVLVVEGYELRAQLTVQDPVQLEFLANRTGDFPVRLDGADQVLTTLRVR